MKYFSIAELSRSEAAIKLNIKNSPGSEAIESLRALVDAVLDPLRERYGQPIYVNSGYRSSMLNRAVGGKPNSQHTKGEAADITTGSKEGNKRLFDIAVDLNLPFDQLIDEYGYRWIHISHTAKTNRHQILHITRTSSPRK